MRRALPVLALALLLALPGAAHAATALEDALAAQMRQTSAASGALVVDAATGAVRYSLRPATRRMPASVEKLWTTSTALRRLGPARQFPTRVYAKAAIDDTGRLNGNLYLKGGGDPTLGAYGMRALARAVTEAGVKRVTGAVVGDDAMFDGVRGVPSSYGGFSPDVEPLSALTYRRNVYGGRYVRAPAANAASALRLQLKRAGVRIDGGARAKRTPEGAAPIAQINGLTLRTLVTRTNVPSDNFYAETLIKDLGALEGTAGSTAAGANVVRSEAAALGAGPAVVDGSGLSRRNRSSPQQLVTLLLAMRTDPAFRGSLATAGRTGTIRTRMRGTPAAGRCRAKTGTLRDVSALAGYCTTTSGRLLAFAILMNSVYPASARRLQDRMAVAMVRYG